MTDKPPAHHPGLSRSPDWLSALRRHTDARIALGRAGAGMPTDPHLAFLRDHAMARDAVHSELAEEEMMTLLGRQATAISSAAPDRQTYLTRPDLGRQLSEKSRARLEAGPHADIALMIGDGLSATAVNQNALPLLGVLLQNLKSTPRIFLARNARVALGDKVAQAIGASWAIVLIGERPGLSAADSLGIYLTYKPGPDTTDANRFCISNIRVGGKDKQAAADRVAALMMRAENLGHSGVTPARHLPDRRG